MQHDLTGQVLKNRYRIEAYLGRGGMAEVYKAYDTRRSYPVAIKVMHADLAEDAEFVHRFRQEAESLATLAHDNIVRFYSFEKEGLQTFLVMDYVEGVTLRRLLAEHEQGLILGQICHVFPQMCQALHYAHEEGFIHRDVKPGNVMIRPDGHVLVTDFGIAKATDAATTTTYMPGTPAYMSPEQCRSESTDRRSDVYALGIVLYEMSTGLRPFSGRTESFTGNTREVIRWEQMNMAPPPPSQLNPNIPSSLERIIQKALNKNPADRFSTVASMLDTFEIAYGDIRPEVPPITVDRAAAIPSVGTPLPSPAMTPPPAHYNTPPPTPSPSKPQSPWLKLLGALAFVALLIAGGWFLAQTNSITLPPDIANQPNGEATGASGVAPTFTLTPEPNTATPTEVPSTEEPEETPTPTVENSEDETASANNLRASANIIRNTALREGPSELYSDFNILSTGSVVEVVGRNDKGTWWQIVHPSGPEGRAWIDADDAELEEGDPFELPIIEVEPPPTETYTPTSTPTDELTPTPEATDTPENTPTPRVVVQLPTNTPAPTLTPESVQPTVPPINSVGTIDTIGNQIINDVDINPRNPNEVYVIIRDDGIYKSLTGGTPPWYKLDINAGGASNLIIDPQNTRRIYLTVWNAVVKSTDGGNSWTAYMNGLSTSNRMVDSLAIHPTNPDILYAGIGATLVISTDGGENWTSNYYGNNLQAGGHIYAIAIDRYNPDKMFVGGAAGSMYLSENSGRNFIQLAYDTGSGTFDIVQHPNKPDIFLAGINAFHAGIIRTTNGADFESVSNGIIFGGADSAYSTLAYAPSNPNIVYAGTGYDQEFLSKGIFKSTNGGKNWTDINNGLDRMQATGFPHITRSIAVHPSNPNLVFAATGTGLYKSTDGGAFWDKQ